MDSSKTQDSSDSFSLLKEFPKLQKDFFGQLKECLKEETQDSKYYYKSPTIDHINDSLGKDLNHFYNQYYSPSNKTKNKEDRFSLLIKDLKGSKKKVFLKKLAIIFLKGFYYLRKIAKTILKGIFFIKRIFIVILKEILILFVKKRLVLKKNAKKEELYLDQFYSVLIDGPQGYGKTTLLRNIGHNQTQKKRYHFIMMDCFRSTHDKDFLNDLNYKLYQKLGWFSRCRYHLNRFISKMMMPPILFILLIIVMSIYFLFKPPCFVDLQYIDTTKDLLKVIIISLTTYLLGKGVFDTKSSESLKIRESIEKILSKKPLILVLDEIDRIPSPLFSDFFASLKTILEIKGIFYIFAWDSKLIENNFKDLLYKETDGSHYQSFKKKYIFKRYHLDRVSLLENFILDYQPEIEVSCEPTQLFKIYMMCFYFFIKDKIKIFNSDDIVDPFYHNSIRTQKYILRTTIYHIFWDFHFNDPYKKNSQYTNHDIRYFYCVEEDYTIFFAEPSFDDTSFVVNENRLKTIRSLPLDHYFLYSESIPDEQCYYSHFVLFLNSDYIKKYHNIEYYKGMMIPNDQIMSNSNLILNFMQNIKHNYKNLMYYDNYTATLQFALLNIDKLIMDLAFSLENYINNSFNLKSFNKNLEFYVNICNTWGQMINGNNYQYWEKRLKPEILKDKRALLEKIYLLDGGEWLMNSTIINALSDKKIEQSSFLDAIKSVKFLNPYTAAWFLLAYKINVENGSKVYTNPPFFDKKRNMTIQHYNELKKDWDHEKIKKAVLDSIDKKAYQDQRGRFTYLEELQNMVEEPIKEELAYIDNYMPYIEGTDDKYHRYPENLF